MRGKTAWTASERRRNSKRLWNGVDGSIGLALLPGDIAGTTPKLRRDPFTLGVASGDPTPYGAVLWTRLAPEPAEPERLGKKAISVNWRVATDERMRKLVSSGSALAPAQLAHSVHVEVNTLKPGRDYFYQFDVRNEESPIGRFRTAPAAEELVSRAKLAFATCQDWASGYYTAYRDMLQHDLDLVVHLGDYTYEHAIQASIRSEQLPEAFKAAPVDLRSYRLRHALYKLDPDLQAAHASFAFAFVWDDHEVQNDCSGLAPERSLDFAARDAAAYQAFYEHLPLRNAVAKFHRELPIFRGLNYGRLFQLSLLDDRQSRSADQEQLRAAAMGGTRTILGAAQERWITDRFERSRAIWNVCGQQLLLAELAHSPNKLKLDSQGAWAGYPHAQQQLWTAIERTSLRNPVFFTGDWHSTFVNDLLHDWNDPNAKPIATELVVPALTTGGDAERYGPYYKPIIRHNPHIKYFDGDQRGYFMATIEPQSMQLDLRYVKSVEDPDAPGHLERSWVIEDGCPGAKPA